jgi:hypothetical protein
MSPSSQAVVNIDLNAPGFYADPYPLYQYLRDNDPVYWSPQWGGWLLTRYQDVVSVLRDAHRFSNVGRMSKFLSQLPEELLEQIRPFREHFEQGLINSDPPNHSRIRGILSKAFTPGLIIAQAPRIQSIVDELLDRVQSKGRMDIITDFAFLLPTTVIAQMLGVPFEDREQFRGWADGINAFVGTGRVLSARALEAQRNLLELREYFRGLGAQRRAEPQDDLVTALANAEDQGTLLNDSELLSVCVTLLLAGYETTMSFLGNAMLALLRNPDQLEDLRRDPSLIPSAIEELLRYDGPIHRQWRVATENVNLGGKLIRKGDLVAAMLGAANHDPEQFPDPERLDVTRQNVRHVAFGYGIHFCLGGPLARLESQIALQTLLRRVPKMHLDCDSLAWRQEITIHGLKTLPIVFQ